MRLNSLSVKNSCQVLFFNRCFSGRLGFPREGVPAHITFSTNKSQWRQSAVVVFHLPGLSVALIKAMALIKPKGQYWVLWSMECEVNYPYLIAPDLRQHFDLEMSYHLDADIPTPYFDHQTLNDLRRPTQTKNSENLICAFISSAHNASGRLGYLRELMSYIEVHSYGRQLNNRQLVGDLGYASKRALLPAYKFCIAFENAICRDYVTEKFFDPLIAGSVPIYLGAPNIAEFAPAPNAYINVGEWPQPRQLAEYLRHLARDESAYQDHLSWKQSAFQSQLVAHATRFKDQAFLRLSRVVADLAISNKAVTTEHPKPVNGQGVPKKV